MRQIPFVYTKKSLFNFGKYKDITLSEVALFDPNYIIWCIQKVDYFAISAEDTKSILAGNINLIHPGIFTIIDYKYNLINFHNLVQNSPDLYNELVGVNRMFFEQILADLPSVYPDDKPIKCIVDFLEDNKPMELKDEYVSMTIYITNN